MRRILLLLAGAVVASSGFAAAAASLHATPADELKVGDQAPDFTLPGSDGRTYTLSQLKGKHVVLAWFPKAFTAG